MMNLSYGVMWLINPTKQHEQQHKYRGCWIETGWVLVHHLLFFGLLSIKSLMTWVPTIIQLIRAISQLFSHGGKSRNKWEQRIKRMDLCFLSKKLIRSRQRNTIGIGGRSINLFWPMGEKLIVLTGQLVPPYHPAF